MTYKKLKQIIAIEERDAFKGIEAVTKQVKKCQALVAKVVSKLEEHSLPILGIKTHYIAGWVEIYVACDKETHQERYELLCKLFKKRKAVEINNELDLALAVVIQVYR